MAANTAETEQTPASKKPAKKTSVKRKATPRKSARKKAVSPRKTPSRASSKTTAKSASANKSDAGYSDRGKFERKAAQTPSQTYRHPLMQTLRDEHRHMAGVMKIFSGQLDMIEAGDLVDPHLVYEIMDYMVTWPDRFHHPREDLIYARVAELDPQGADEVDTLQRDHDNTAKLGRRLLQDVQNWRQGDISGSKLIKSGRAYVDHIHEHMNVEEKLVFPHITEVLSAQDWRELEAEDQLAAVSLPIFGPAVQREFRNMARKVRRSVRRSVEQQTLAEWIGIDAFMESMEVLSLAYDSSRHSASERGRDAFREALDIIRQDPMAAPLKVAANNTRVTLGFLGEVAQISRETIDDLASVNQARKDRTRMLARKTR